MGVRFYQSFQEDLQALQHHVFQLYLDFHWVLGHQNLLSNPSSRGSPISLQNNAFTIISLLSNLSVAICNIHRGNIDQYTNPPIIITNGSNKCTIYIRMQSVRWKSKHMTLLYFSIIVLILTHCCNDFIHQL